MTNSVTQHEDGTDLPVVKSSKPTVSQLNNSISLKLAEYADVLEQQGADSFRINAYRRAAVTVASLEQSVDDILVKDGQKGLIALPSIGKSIASVIAEIVLTGQWAQLERLHGEVSPTKLFQTIPGIGPKLAKRLTDEEHLETLEDLEAAIHRDDNHIKGFGPKRREAVAAILVGRLSRIRGSFAVSDAPVPPVEMLLQVDAMYRERAANGTLRKIKPRRFNPAEEAWLPVMHASHDPWHFTALFSNTAHAHQLKKTRDWVVIHFQADGHSEGGCTVVTEFRGPRTGQRVVRGREAESPVAHLTNV